MTKDEKANYEIITEPKEITKFLEAWWDRNANNDIFHKSCYIQEAYDSVFRKIVSMLSSLLNLMKF